MAVTFRASGPDRGPDKARDVSTLPKTFVPARRRTVPFTTTFLSSCAANFFPTRSCEETVSTVCTTKGVPAGMVAAEEENRDPIKMQPVIAIRISVLVVIRIGVDGR